MFFFLSNQEVGFTSRHQGAYGFIPLGFSIQPMPFVNYYFIGPSQFEAKKSPSTLPFAFKTWKG